MSEAAAEVVKDPISQDGLLLAAEMTSYQKSDLQYLNDAHLQDALNAMESYNRMEQLLRGEDGDNEPGQENNSDAGQQEQQAAGSEQQQASTTEQQQPTEEKLPHLPPDDEAAAATTTAATNAAVHVMVADREEEDLDYENRRHEESSTWAVGQDELEAGDVINDEDVNAEKNLQEATIVAVSGLHALHQQRHQQNDDELASTQQAEPVVDKQQAVEEVLVLPTADGASHQQSIEQQQQQQTGEGDPLTEPEFS